MQVSAQVVGVVEESTVVVVSVVWAALVVESTWAFVPAVVASVVQELERQEQPRPGQLALAESVLLALF